MAEGGGSAAGVELDGVSVTFGGVTALSDVDLSVGDGEFFTLVGPSGCGKTTTLRTVAGFETPSSGTVRIGGTDVTDHSPEDRDIGIVFQNYALFPHMTVRENVAYGLRYRSPPGEVDTAERVTAMLELVDMAGMGDRQPGSLSGGQKQRIALARALAPGPDVLLLDEPLSALDARLRERLRVSIRGIQRELDITTVYVTHDQEEALAISDRIAVVRDGHVEQVGTPQAVYHTPATRFVAEFMGENNVFDATVASRDPPRASLDGTTLPVDGPLPDRERVPLCVRPEDVTLGDGDVTLPVTVEHVEFLGDAYRVHCEWNGESLLAKTRREPAENAVSIGIDAVDVTVVGSQEE